MYQFKVETWEIPEDGKLISDVTRENNTHVIHTFKMEVDCNCCSHDKGEGDVKYGPQNCNCYEKYSHFSYYSKDRRDWEEKGKREGFGPCIKCKGTGRQINTSTSKYQKFYCVGGPFDQKMVCSPEAGDEYVPYNCADAARRSRKKEIAAGHRYHVILVHKSLLC